MILDVSSCSDPGLGFILRIIKMLFTILEVAAPIVLIVSLGIILTKLLADPSNDKLKKNLTNSILSCVIVFLLPLLVNLTMSLFGQRYSFSQCWNNAYSSTGSSRFIQREDSEGKTPLKFILNLMIMRRVVVGLILINLDLVMLHRLLI